MREWDFARGTPAGAGGLRSDQRCPKREPTRRLAPVPLGDRTGKLGPPAAAGETGRSGRPECQRLAPTRHHRGAVKLMTDSACSSDDRCDSLLGTRRPTPSAKSPSNSGGDPSIISVVAAGTSDDAHPPETPPPRPGDGSNHFDTLDPIAHEDISCVILSFHRRLQLLEAALQRRFCADCPRPVNGPPPTEQERLPGGDGPAFEKRPRPRWDRRSMQLWFGVWLCKSYRRAAPNQWLILDAFEEEGWPPRIDDPIPGCGPDGDPRQRRADAVRFLNRRCEILDFFCDGTGEGICWREVEPRPDSTRLHA